MTRHSPDHKPGTPAPDALQPFRVMKVMKKALALEEQGRQIVHMEVGEPDFTTARPIIEAACAAMEQGRTGYTDAAGIAPLRRAISEHYRKGQGLDIDPRRIFITPGASGGLNLLAALLIRAGDGVLMADPGYPCNPNFVRIAGGEPQRVAVDAGLNYQPDAALLEQRRRSNTTGLWLASPANPTGTVLSRERLREVSQWARECGYHRVVDEIYHGLHYTGELASALEVDDESFVINSFSKYFGMTGWRLGWLVVPEPYIERVEILMQNLFICAPTVSQYAALAAFEPETVAILEQRRQAFRERRDFLVDALRDIGFTIPTEVQGAFYVYAGIEAFSDDSESFCAEMLERHGVAITPGTDFGLHGAHHHVRFAFTTDMDKLKLGVARLRAALA